MNTEYQTLVTWHDCVTCVRNIRHFWHDMSVWHEYRISDICDMTWFCFMSTEYQKFVAWNDMTLSHDYWIWDICDMICHDCVSWLLNIWHLWHDISLWHVYWLSDICGVTWICDKFTEYKSFVTWHDCVTLVLKIRHLYNAMILMCDMRTLIRHFCNYMTLCH